MSDPAPSLYHQYVESMHKIAGLRYAGALMQWDQETNLPPAGAHFRGQQISVMSEIAHELFSSDTLGDILTGLLQTQLGDREHMNVVRTSEDYNKNKKYPAAFIRKISQQVPKAYHAWLDARKQNDFSVFEKELSPLVELKKEEAEILGYEKHPYDALLDEFEKGATVEMLDKAFGDLLPPLRNLFNQLIEKETISDDFLRQHFPKEAQWKWSLELAARLGFDFNAGRQDMSEHPFSTSFNPQDVRITTRISEDDFANMTWSTIHEVGHGLYEQGLPISEYGLPLGEACSYSIHESQSRLWENAVGRSRPFCEYFLPRLKEYFPQQFEKINVGDFYRGINKVVPSLIRTEADEITYHFHVFIRYELEKALLEGQITTKDIPAYWNEQYAKYLQVTVPDDRQGCLQDVHWSHGTFGYFPTYSLGSLYASQFFAEAQKNIPDLDKQIGQGVLHNLLSWLRERIHVEGKYYLSEELCAHVTGEPLNPDHFMKYLLEKYHVIYNL